jgi:hypothetical protein
MRRKIFTEENMIKVKTMAEQGYGAAQIAYEIKSTPGSVRVMCSNMKIKLRHTKFSSNSPMRWVTSKVSESTFLELDRYARQREMPVQTLVAQILEIIAKDNLFDAVLDEAPLQPMLVEPEMVE